MKITSYNLSHVLLEGRWGLLLITHYKRILEHVKPSRILVIKGGKIIAEGGNSLIDELEAKRVCGLLIIYFYLNSKHLI